MSPGITVAQRSFGQTVVTLARSRGLIRGEGTATAGSGTTLTDATNFRLTTANSAQVIGKFLYIWGGTSAGTIREITSYGTIGVFTWTGSATTPDTTSTWILLDRNPQYLVQAVLEAQRVLGFDTLVPYDSTSLVSNNLLDWMGDFEEWAASTYPNGWTLGANATVTQNTEYVLHGLSSMQVVAAGGAGGISFNIGTTARPTERTRLLDDQTVTVRGAMSGTGACTATLRAINLAGTETSLAAFTYTGGAAGRWEELQDISTATFTLPTEMNLLALDLRVPDATTCYFDDFKIYGPTLYTQTLPDRLVAMHPVIWMEADSDNGDYSLALHYKEDWMLRPKSSTTQREIQWLKALPSDRHLLIKGLQIAAVVSATATNLNIDADLVAAVAAGLLNDATPTEKAEAREAQRRKARIARSGPWVWIDHSLATT